MKNLLKFNTVQRKNKWIFIEDNQSFVEVYKCVDLNFEYVKGFNKVDLLGNLNEFKSNDKKISKSELIWILSNNKYEILSFEKSEFLEKSELKTYVEFKIKESLGLFDISAGVYDYVLNKESENSFLKKNMMSVFYKSEEYNELLSVFKKSNLTLTKLDTIEFISRNLLNFKLNNNVSNSVEPIAVFNLMQNVFNISIYMGDMFLLSRNIDLSKYESDDFNGKKDKIVLELQRNIDYLDRQMGIGQFEKVLLINNNDVNVGLYNEIIGYFNLKKLEANLSDFGFNLTKLSKDKKNKDELKFKEDLNIENKFGLIALSCVLDNLSEVKEDLNLIKETSNRDFKRDGKAFVLSVVLIGLGISVLGSVFEYRNKDNAEKLIKVTSELDTLKESNSKYKNMPIAKNAELEESIKNLGIIKNELLKDSGENNIIYIKTLEQLSVLATKNGVVFTKFHINGSANNISIVGKSVRKENIGLFLDQLKEYDLFADIKINAIEIKSSEDGFVFTLANNGISIGNINNTGNK